MTTFREQNVNAVVAFNSSAYPLSLALTTPTELRIGRIEDIQRVDIRAIPLEEDEPRRIAHDPVSKTYGVVCLRRDINRVTGEQSTVGSVKIFDDQSFKGALWLLSTGVYSNLNVSCLVLADLPLDEHEECQSIIAISIGDSVKYAVGTAYVLASEPEPTKGRLLLFSETADRTFEQKSARIVNGCPYALAALSGNFIAAAVNSQVRRTFQAFPELG